MSCDLSRQINAEKRIGVQAMGGQVQIGWKVILQCDIPLNRQVSLIESGVGIEIELCSMSDRINVEISGALFIESEILKMDVRLNRRLLGSAADSHRESADAIGRHASGLQAWEAGEIQVASGKIQAKLNVRAVDVRAADVRPA